MNSGTMPAYGNAGPFPSQSALLPMHPDDQMFLDVFAQDLGHTSVNGQSLDALPPLDFGNPGSPAVEFLQDFDDGVDTAFKSYAAQLDGLASGLPNSQPLLPPQQSPPMMTAQPGGDPAAPSLGWGLDGSQGGAVSHQGSGGSPHGHGFTSEGSSELAGTPPSQSDVGASKRKKKAASEAAELVKQRAMLKEKNREAQKKYRERQKCKLQESEDKVSELTEQINALQVEKASLANRNELLEKFLTMQQQQQTEVAREPTGSLSISRSSHVWWLDDRTKQLIETTVNLRGGQDITIEFIPSSPLTLTQEQAANLTDEQFTELWQEYVSAAAECLLKANDDVDSEAGKRLVRLTRQAGQIKSAIAMWRPDKFQEMNKRLMGIDTATGMVQRMSTAQALELANSAKFSEQQVHVIIRMRTLYLHNLGALVRRRQQMAAVLQEADHAASHQQLFASVHLTSMHAVERLRDTLRSEHSFSFQLMMTLWRRVMTPIQAARVSVTAYPIIQVDMLAVINALAEEKGEKSTAELVLEGQQLAETILVPIDTIAGIATVAEAINKPGAGSGAANQQPIASTA